MDLSQDYNPQHCVDGIRFRLYTSAELKILSVKEIRNPETFDNVNQPTIGGLYDPALGPVDRNDACATCGQGQVHCPGHMGHIDLPLLVHNPLFFTTLYKILKSSCFQCHQLNVDPTQAHLFIHQCRVLDYGQVARVGELEDLYGQAMHDPSNENDDGKKRNKRETKDHIAQKCREVITEFTDCAVKESMDVDVLVKNVEDMRNMLIKNFMKEHMKKNGKCLNPQCSAAIRTLRQEHQAKIILQGKLNQVASTTPSKYTRLKKVGENKAMEEDSPDDLSDDSNDEQPPPKKQKVSVEKGKSSRSSGEVTLLTALMVRDHLRQVWKHDGALLRRLFAMLASSSSESPMDIFFLDTVPVPPSRYRPMAELQGRKLENAQTANLGRVLKSASATRELLWHIEKSAASTQIPGDDVIPLSVSRIPGQTLMDKLNNSQTALQTSVNCLMDSRLDKISKDVCPGIRQLLEQKEGLFRKNMMGKRVNYACRSVISPDSNINSNEIGIPMVFAKVLTYPQPVTPWNFHELKQAVINGPTVHPGAVQVQNEDGSIVLLQRKNVIQREAIAKQLLTPRTSHGKLVTGTKKVFRHLKNGDVLLVNRQPTLHRPSIQAHKARVLPGEKTLRLHYANCKAYNADFDGDEMNAHFPQNEIARSEAYNIACTDYQYLVPKDGTPLAGLIQDHMVSGVSLTIRGRFFHREDYCRLVYTALVDKSGPVKLLPPSIIKPYRLWSGKQVLSSVILNLIPHGQPKVSLTGRAKVPEKSWMKVAPSSRCSDTPSGMGESDVVIQHGQLLVGVLDKGHYGPTPFGLIHSCYELYGGQVAGQMLTCFGRLFINFLQWKGFTLGVEDILVTKKANKKRHQIIKKSPSCGEGAAMRALGCDRGQLPGALRSALYNKDDRQMRELDQSMRTENNEIQNNIVNTCMPGGLEKLFPDNNLQLMVTSGAKGSSVNCMQISCLLGQIELEGKRPPPMVSGRTLPSFLPFDVTPRAGGFVTGRFLTGIRQQEYFFHCMAGREGLIDTAVKTSRSGYLQRCLIKHLEGIKVNYDLTVRDGDSSVVQFYYGEDGLDISKTGYLDPKQFDFLTNNQQQGGHRHTNEKDVSKVKKLEKKIKKWYSNHGSVDGKSRQSGFLRFCQLEGNSAEVGKTKVKKNNPGRSRADLRLCDKWRALDDKKKAKYNKENGRCPDPVMAKLSPYTDRVQPEKLAGIIQQYAKDGLQMDSSMDKGQFQDLMDTKLKRSIAEPGDSVGLLCAQSIGEPSTQMTLNTFHFAGRGEMNVTLGIPRLREILMVGSRNIKTPAMDVPVIPGSTHKEKAKTLQKELTKVYLKDVLKDVKVSESISKVATRQRDRKFKVEFAFLPWACYKERFALKPKQILAFMEDRYIRKLVSLIRAKIKSMSSDKLITHGVQRRARARKDPVDEDVPGKAATAMTRTDDDDDSDGDDGVGDGDTTAEKEKKKHREEHEYEDEETDEDEENRTLNDEEQVDMDLSEHENLDEVLIGETPIKNDHRKDRKEAVRAQVSESRIQAVTSTIPEVTDYNYDAKKELWCQVTLNFSIRNSKIDLLALIENDVQKVVVHEVSGISRCILGDEQGQRGTELHLKTEGINMHKMYQHADFLDVNRLYSNNIHAVAETYGIEAASKVIIKEIQAVFAAYGIQVDYRHLSLLADYMTFEGKYKPFNRMAMESNPSPLQKMSFETTMHFLVESSMNCHADNLTSPSAQIVLGKNVSCGTGCHDLFNPLIKL